MSKQKSKELSLEDLEKVTGGKDIIEAQPEENNSEELTTIVAYLDVDTNSK